MDQRLFSALAALTVFSLFSGIALAQNTPPKPVVVDPSVPILNQINDISCILYSIILYSSSAIAAVLIILAGMEYLSSGDDPGKRDHARNRIIYSLAGLVLVILACPIIDYMVTNTEILPFQRSCDCLGGHTKATTTTTIATATTTTTRIYTSSTTTTSESATTTTSSP